MTREELALVLTEIEAFWPHRPVQGEVAVAAWWELLRDRPSDAVTAWIRKHAKSGAHWPPLPGEVFNGTAPRLTWREQMQERWEVKGDHRARLALEAADQRERELAEELKSELIQLPERDSNAA